MPHITNSLHQMDDLEISIRSHPGSADCPPYASIGLQPKDDSESWTFFYRDIESIREFRNRLNAAIIKYDTRKSSEAMVERIERAAEKIHGDEHIISDYLQAKGRE